MTSNDLRPLLIIVSESCIYRSYLHLTNFLRRSGLKFYFVKKVFIFKKKKKDNLCKNNKKTQVNTKIHINKDFVISMCI